MFKNLWRWQVGRQKTGYRKCLLAGWPWGLPWDLYLLHYPTGTGIPTHTDPVHRGRHYRFNVVLWKSGSGGEFYAKQVLAQGRRWCWFRSDLTPHGVTPVESGERWVLSLGWIVLF